MALKRMTLAVDNQSPKLLYHGSKKIVEVTEVRSHRHTKDFGRGFYCTEIQRQAHRWAIRVDGQGVVNCYDFAGYDDLHVKKFESMNEEWLDFVVHCRCGGGHNYDIVEGPMADDIIANAIQEYIDGTMNREVLLVTLKFSIPTHQISFHTSQALECLTFRGANYV